MEKLISMVDFVFLIDKMPKDGVNWTYKRMNQILQYAMFLKQPLTLGMFVPTDLNGNVLEEPEDYKDSLLSSEDYAKLGYVHCNEWHKTCAEYQEAKDRVLFEGFEFVKKKFNNSEYEYLSNGDIYVFSFWENKWQLNDLFKNIEDLIKFQLVLTKSAKNQIKP